jgi:hypothetical protein
MVTTRLKKIALSAAIVATFIASGAHAQGKPVALADATLKGDEVIATPIGEIELVDNYFDDKASKRLFDEMDYQRAAQAYIWSIPLVGFTTWRDEQARSYGTTNEADFAVFESLKEKRGIVTGNLTTPYIINFTNLKSGPIQIDYPTGQTAGGVLDFWQRPVFDLGLTGPDQGKGATYIVVGPEDDPEKYKKDGVYVYQSATNSDLEMGSCRASVGAEYEQLQALRSAASGIQPPATVVTRGSFHPYTHPG